MLVNSLNGWSASNFPNPTVNSEKCGRQNVYGQICDPDQVLSQNQGNQLQYLIGTIFREDKTTCNNEQYAFQIGVAIVQKLDLEQYSKDQASQNFAEKVFDNWGLGYAACQTGILVFLTIQDRFTYIKTGSVAKQYLTNSDINYIVTNVMNPQFKVSNYFQGLYDGISKIQERLEGKISFDGSNAGIFVLIAFFIICGLTVIISAICIFLNCSSRRRDEKKEQCRQKLEQLQKQKIDSKMKKYQQITCPICLENLSEKIIYPGDQFESAAKTTTVLFCGHTFCSQCLQKANASICPICRTPIASVSSSQCPQYQSCYENSMSDNEFVFRVAQLQLMFPDYITSSSAAILCNSTYNGSYAELCLPVNYPIENGQDQSSIGGYSFDFGGGSGGDGGGAGSSW